ncbi:MAG TPA: TetR/AcrR family transcriptional regulator [Acidimicrobiales bacterium]|nr:TetR/AcrR family transcriptional regulator [Acidimicrobiales bacterium]
MPETPRRVGRPRGPRVDPAERREELLDACVTAIRKHGPEVSMAELAETAGVSRPILYDHFGDRSGVASALVNRYAAELVPAISGVFDTSVPLREAVAKGIDIFCTFVEKEPEVFRFMFEATDQADPGAMNSALGAMFASSFSASLFAVGRDPAMGDVWGHALPGAVFAAVEWWSATRTMPRKTLVGHLTSLVADAFEAAGVTRLAPPA